MESVNLTALLSNHNYGADRDGGASTTYTSSTEYSASDVPSLPSILSATANGVQRTKASSRRSESGSRRLTHAYESGCSTARAGNVHRHREVTEAELIHRYGTDAVGPKLVIDGHTDLRRDSTSLIAYWNALFFPEVYLAIFYALRITLIVALPLGIIARVSSVAVNFPAHAILSMYSIVDCRYTFGEQVAACIVTIQCSLWTMLWGSLNNTWSLSQHPVAWWLTVVAVSFAVSLLGDVRARRLLVLQSVMILQMEKLPGGTDILYPVKVGRDIMMATGFAFLQSFFPLRSIAANADDALASGFKALGTVIHSATTACWSSDPIECVLALGQMSTEPMQNISSTLPGTLFFVMYEFWESSLRLELRKERLRLMELCLPRIHAITDTVRTMVMKRAYNVRSGGSIHGTHDPNTEPFFEHGNSSTTHMRGPHHHTSSLREPPQPGSGCVMQAALPSAWTRSREILMPAVEAYLEALDAVLEALGRHLNPRDTAENVPFHQLRLAAGELQAKINQLHFELLIKSEEAVDPFLYSNLLFIHLSLVMMAERFVQYGESMTKFDRKRYKSQLRRAWEFFFYDYWSSFWEELPKRLTLATPRDVRLLKDAIKITIAYAIGVMFTQSMDRVNVYYFGMAILMGVGLPTAGDTMEVSVYRVTGMLCACSIAFVAIWHTSNTAGELAIALAGTFIALLFRDRLPYSHAAQYCSMLILAALNTASSKLVLLSRIISNSFTVMAYYAIVVFIFPIDVLRVTYNAQVTAMQLVMDRFSRVVDVMSQPLSSPDPAHAAALREEVDGIRGEQDKMWLAVKNVGMWLPKAAADPAPHGSPYPLNAMKDMYSSLRRLASATDILSTALLTLHRAGVYEPRFDVQHILSAVAPVMQLVDRLSRVLFQDFLDAISRPYDWTPETATLHFSNFLSLSAELHSSFQVAHRRNVRALRENFRLRVMNRTFVAAASSRLFNPDTIERVQNHSIALQEAASFAFQYPGSRSGGSPSLPSYSPPMRPVPSDEVLMPRHLPRGSLHVNFNFGPEKVKNLSLVRNFKEDAEGDADDGMAEGSPVLDGGIARSLAETMATAQSDARRTSLLAYQNSPFLPPAASPTVPGDSVVTSDIGPSSIHVDGDNVQETVKRSLEAAAFEKALNPMEEQAQREEYHHFVSQRNPHFELQPGEYTLSHDINMIISILVATDMFFAEAERLLKTMYIINRYARSRTAPPRERRVSSN